MAEVYSIEGMQVTEHLFRGLLMIDGELNVLPSMADNMRVSSDGPSYLFRLREDARWSDGEPLTADDFAFAWRRMREPTRTASRGCRHGRGARRPHVEARPEPRNFFPYILASPWSFPWPRHKCEELGDDWQKPENLVGNGPFMLEQYGDDQAVLTANPHWSGPRGNVREIEIAFVSKGRERVDRWTAGEFDSSVWNAAVTARPRRKPSSSLSCTPDMSDSAATRRRSTMLSFAKPSRMRSRGGDLGPEDSESAATRGGAIPPAMPGHSHRPPGRRRGCSQAARGGRPSERPRSARAPADRAAWERGLRADPRRAVGARGAFISRFRRVTSKW